MKTILYTVFALVAFAANSVLCRMALGEGEIDASSFTIVRLLSGVVVLAIIFKMKSKSKKKIKKGGWLPAFMLFLYACTFSFAYVSLDTGTGALILFGAVQITMIMASVISGNKLHISEWLGTIVAFTGFVYLFLPGLTTPSVFGFILMSASGIAWGSYTLSGRISSNPFHDTAINFAKTIPFVLVLLLFAYPTIKLSFEGLVLATLSGAVASGLGYTIWYKALGNLSVTVAAVVQLSVPVIAALGGVLFVSETISVHLMTSGVLILGGILVVVLGRYYFVNLKMNVKHIPNKLPGH